ncbi:MAG: hypothetical protein HY711_06015 [Candidatus Melainabacteria bacterium]|nr:hypothetical protein [Candidatus Melainabacteria bacterium]
MSSRVVILLMLAANFSTLQVLAQNSGPVPGSAGSSAVMLAPVPGGAQSQMTNSSASGRAEAARAYQQLPISYADAQARVDELKCLLPQAKPQDIQESIYQLIDWLADISDAHNRLAISFAKQESTKTQADAERQAAQKLRQLKNQALLLKADLLIKQMRFPEALGPLVEIVVAEPKTPTGLTAYKRLKEIGFAEEIIEEIKPVLSSESIAPTPSSPHSANTQQQDSQTLLSQSPSSKTSSIGKLTIQQATGNTQSVVKTPTKSPTVWITGSPVGPSARSNGPNLLTTHSKSH